MSTSPEAPASGAALPSTSQRFKSCLSCRMLSGSGLVLSGAYVFHRTRWVLQQGGPPTIGIAAALTFAGCLLTLGVVIIVDPVDKRQRKF